MNFFEVPINIIWVKNRDDERTLIRALNVFSKPEALKPFVNGLIDADNPFLFIVFAFREIFFDALRRGVH
jgi:hypothetical protein